MLLSSSFSHLCSLVLLVSLSSCLTAPPVPTVTAPFGTIFGQPGRLDPTVHEYLGIPFAHPPIGRLRFHPPVRLANRSPQSPPIVATKFGLSCPSVPIFLGFDNPYNFTGTTEGEDCLTLNIWTKPGRTNTPVMVWIYPGGFMLGGTDTLLYDGTLFAANHDVVMVSVNYRMNVFGFPNSPALNVQNLGILDQRVALEWVRDNIHAFGGNPDKITIFGQSAGGISVDVHAYAWPHDPIASALIIQSGNLETLSRVLNGGYDFDEWGNLTAQVGCGNAGPDKQKLQCMQEVPWEALIEGIKIIQPCPSIFYFSFAPRVDGKVIFSAEEYKRRGESGLFAKLPLLVGNTDTEWPPGALPAPPIEGCPVMQLPQDSLDPVVIANLLTTALFTCPARETALRRVLHNIPVWRYRYYGSFNSGLGATHCSELPALFGAAQEVRILSERDKAFIKYLQSVWVAFASDPPTGLSEPPFNLTQFNPNESTLIRLDYQQELEASTTHPYNYDYLCDVILPRSLL
ncbi:Alpha/Beta hydrolase protein [Kalaharituber pfeilii]|nr:Alpha/Beta hydrolase protein [Kalaharituber pfeilii]